MKRDDLNTTLHQKYNTLTLTLQDPEAFHHDVYELSQQAASADEFHGLMAQRQQQRIHELTQSMESMAVEIIANPALMDTEQWQHALQLFRCKSYDSIVRYFASYLPEGYLDKDSTTTTSSFSSTTDVEEDAFVQPCNTTKAADAADDTPLYLDDDDFFPHGPVMTIKTDAIALEAQPLSPPHSEGSPSDESDSASFSSGSPSRSMSFSGSESGQLPAFMLHSMTDDTASQSDSGETVATSLYDSVESVGSFDDDDDILCTTQHSEDYFDYVDSVASPMSLSAYADSGSDDNTPTPRAESRPAASSLERENHIYNYNQKETTTYDRAGKKFALQLKRSASPPSYVRSRADGLTSAKLRRGPDLASNKIHKCPAYDLRKRMAKSGRRKMMNVD